MMTVVGMLSIKEDIGGRSRINIYIHLIAANVPFSIARKKRTVREDDGHPHHYLVQVMATVQRKAKSALD